MPFPYGSSPLTNTLSDYMVLPFGLFTVRKINYRTTTEDEKDTFILPLPCVNTNPYARTFQVSLSSRFGLESPFYSADSVVRRLTPPLSVPALLTPAM